MDSDVDPLTSLHPENMQHNARSLNYVRSSISIISGILAGVIGLTSYSGFVFYLLTSILAGLVVNVCNTALRPKQYFKNGYLETATQGLAGNLMAYLLFWTLFYGLVHVYEA
ncbi:DUF786-domain-containing protein [Cystobasidium minutum MCA 4210]|uniref:DUF786-domain-containing protein n=1 Tax=Cystobasidium minutum MCA 4210 TaxID=1397322 RepID=UPI0034CF23B7|eukprot:jgi/Rhomi1/73322/CE73321_713